MDAAAATPLQDDRFLLLEALGHGGMGVVYRAYDRAEQRLVALKVPSADARFGPDHPLATEFERWSRLRHPNVVRIYEMGRAATGPLRAGTPYLVLEHVSGGPAHRTLRPGYIEDRLAENLAVQVLHALDHVHAAGFVHRDLKPGNVLVRMRGRGPACFKLTDFGLAAPAGHVEPFGALSGSLPYVAPESLLGIPIDGRADLYGLGLVLYRLVTGRLPVAAGSARHVLDWHLNGSVADPTVVRPNVSQSLRRCICRLTRRDPDDRPGSAVEALSLLGVRAAVPPRLDESARDDGRRAALRLALDSVRLGARRVFRLPPQAAAAESLAGELSVWCQIRGLRIRRLAGDVERLVVRLLADRGATAADRVRRFGLDRHLSLALVGNVALRNPSPARSSEPVPHAVRAVAEFVEDCAATRPLVLVARPVSGESPLAAALRRRLIDDTSAGRLRPSGEVGGFLLLVDAAP